MLRTLARRTIAAMLTLLILTGCNDASVRIAREAADRQAEQNKQMAALQGEVAAGTKRLVEEDGKARQEVLAAHRGLQAERSQLFTSWNSLESERKAIAGERRTESLLAVLFRGTAATAAAVLALALAWLTLFGLRKHDDAPEAVCELLIGELVADAPMFGELRHSHPPSRSLLQVDPQEIDHPALPSNLESP